MGKKTKDFSLATDSDSVGYTKSKKVNFFSQEDPFILQSGAILETVEVEYETYGNLNANKNNAILICHALTGDAHAAGWDTDTDGWLRSYRKNKPGWWDEMIGPSKAIDSNQYFIICANILGSCYGTTGPYSINPNTNKPYGLSFPVITVEDWVKMHIKLLSYLKIEKLHAAIGGSAGGQQVLELALREPDISERIIILSAAHRSTSQGLAFNSVGRHAILSDNNFFNGNYYQENKAPLEGLAAARMLAHITYLSEESMGIKFGRKLSDKDSLDFTLTGVEFEVESYLNYQGESFVKRYDANSYLYITRAMDYYNAAQTWGNGNLKKAAQRIKAKTMVIAFSSDWLFPPQLCRKLVSSLCKVGKTATYVNIESKYGHDAFLVETQTVQRLIKSYLNN